MSHIQRRKSPTTAKVTWRVRYIDPDGHEKSRSFKRKTDAETFDTGVSHNLLSGAYVDPALGQQTVQQYLEDWRARQAHHRPKTAASTRTRFRTMVYPHLGQRPIGKLRPSDIQKWQAALVADDYAPSTINGVRGQVAGAFNDAVTDRRIASNPFLQVKPIDDPAQEVVPRTIAQVRAGQAAITNDRYRAVIPVDAGSGLRWAELFGLTVDRVNFLKRTIKVDRQLVGREKGGAPIFGPPKTKKSNRTVPVGKTVLDALAEHLRKYPAERHELIFRTAQGGALTRGVWQRAWIPARDAMELQPGEGLHQLRHFYASLLIKEGLNVKEVQERLGHKTADETLNTYAHLWPGSEDRTRDAIDRAFTETHDDEEGTAAHGMGEN